MYLRGDQCRGSTIKLCPLVRGLESGSAELDLVRTSGTARPQRDFARGRRRHGDRGRKTRFTFIHTFRIEALAKQRSEYFVAAAVPSAETGRVSKL